MDKLVRHDATNSLDNPFWRYSISVYNNSDLQILLLEGQAMGLDVNVLLFCSYLAHHNKSFVSVQSCLRTVEQWQREKVQVIRRLRQRVKELNNEWYDAMKELELLAEQIEQKQLFQISDKAEVSLQKLFLRDNLKTYLKYKNIEPEKKWLQALIKHLQPS